MKKIFALTAISVALLGAGCSSDDDDDNDDDDNMGMETGGDDGGMPTGPDAVDLTTVPAYDPAAQTPPATASLGELLPVAGLTQLNNAVAGCPDILAAATNADARLTVFAPDDEAFGEDDVQAAIAGGADVCAVLADHVVVGAVLTSEFLAQNVGNTVETLSGRALLIGTDEDDDDGDSETDELTIEGVEVESADNFATNGVAHVIGSVILPAASGGETGGDDGTEGEDDGNDDGSDTGGGNAEIGPVGTTLQNTAAVSTFAGAFIGAFNNSLDGPGGSGPNTWTVFAPSNDALDEADLDASDLDQAVLFRHIHPDAALSPSELGGVGTLTMTSGSATYDIATDADGNVTIAGFPVTEIANGQSVVYQIEGILP